MRKSKHDWKSLLAAHARSGQTIAAFCKARGLPISNFYAARLRDRPASGLIPISVVARCDETIRVELKLGGSMAEIRASASDLASLLRAL